MACGLGGEEEVMYDSQKYQWHGSSRKGRSPYRFNLIVHRSQVGSGGDKVDVEIGVNVFFKLGGL